MKNCLKIFTLVVILTFGCQKNRPEPNAPKTDGKRSLQEFMKTIKPGRYEASDTRKNQIYKNYLKLKVGMSKEEVSFLIGDPDYSDPSYGPKSFNPKWKGWSWKYNIVWENTKFVNEHNDEWIKIYFGTDDRAHWIVASRKTGLPSIGR